MGISFEQIYRDNFRYIYNMVYMRVLHRETAEDITSQVFLNAFAAFDRFDQDNGRATPKTWLVTIARNAIIDHARLASVRHEQAADELPEVPVFDETDGTQLDLMREVHRIFSHLSDTEREILTLRDLMELSYHEIAEILGISEAAATERHRRTIAKCRTLEAGKSLSDFI
ncbi:MAG: sigma-70 family RNA polymerase sigma factor [Lachnospiraceae bacterium]|nr:sigma-70 family RNA polymerase sigma factor [Lachnospiraceae bacterium]